MGPGFILALILGIPASMTTDGLELYNLDFELRQYVGTTNNPLVTQRGRELDKEVKLNLDLRFFKSFYWSNQVDSLMDKGRGTGQFRTVAWENKVGWLFSNNLAIEIGHRSTHMLDDVFLYSSKPFYSEDWVGLKWTFHSGSSPKEALKDYK